jgi:hypothetical protein
MYRERERVKEIDCHRRMIHDHHTVSADVTQEETTNPLYCAYDFQEQASLQFVTEEAEGNTMWAYKGLLLECCVGEEVQCTYGGCEIYDVLEFLFVIQSFVGRPVPNIQIVPDLEHAGCDISAPVHECLEGV